MRPNAYIPYLLRTLWVFQKQEFSNQIGYAKFWLSGPYLEHYLGTKTYLLAVRKQIQFKIVGAAEPSAAKPEAEYVQNTFFVYFL